MDNPVKAASTPSPVLEHASFRLPSTLESVGDVERAAEAMAGRLGFDEDTASNIAMVTREATINACKHGNHFAQEKLVTVTLDRSADTLTICVSDEGEGLNPDALPDPCDPANLLRASGRGVFLMRAIMDEVHFRQLQPGTQVTLIKHKYLEATS